MAINGSVYNLIYQEWTTFNKQIAKNSFSRIFYRCDRYYRTIFFLHYFTLVISERNFPQNTKLLFCLGQCPSLRGLLIFLYAKFYGD